MQTRTRQRTSDQTGLAKCALRWCRGGRFGELARRAFHQQSENKLGEYPTARQVGLLGGQTAEVEQGFEALEQELDLPAQPVKLKNGFGTVFVRQAGQQQDIAGGLQGARIDFLSTLAGSRHHL